jgi:hypothetical protein
MWFIVSQAPTFGFVLYSPYARCVRGCLKGTKTTLSLECFRATCQSRLLEWWKKCMKLTNYRSSKPPSHISASHPTSAHWSVRRHFQSEHLASLEPDFCLYALTLLQSPSHSRPTAIYTRNRPIPLPHTTTMVHTPLLPRAPFRVHARDKGIVANQRRQAQTPQQRQANMRFAKAQEKKMGKPEAPVVVKRGPQKSPISKIWISTCVPFPAYFESRKGVDGGALAFVLRVKSREEGKGDATEQVAQESAELT